MQCGSSATAKLPFVRTRCLSAAPLAVDARVIRETRKQLNVSRAVFARGLRVSTRTLENWEQGRAQPNAQAAALILMVRRYPDTLRKLQLLDA